MGGPGWGALGVLWGPWWGTLDVGILTGGPWLEDPGGGLVWEKAGWQMSGCSGL